MRYKLPGLTALPAPVTDLCLGAMIFAGRRGGSFRAGISATLAWLAAPPDLAAREVATRQQHPVKNYSQGGK